MHGFGPGSVGALAPGRRRAVAASRHAGTRPNGLPYCEAYEFDGSAVRFSSPLGTLDHDDGLRLHFYVGMTIGGKVAFDGFPYLPE